MGVAASAAVAVAGPVRERVTSRHAPYIVLMVVGVLLSYAVLRTILSRSGGAVRLARLITSTANFNIVTVLDLNIY